MITLLESMAAPRREQVRVLLERCRLRHASHATWSAKTIRPGRSLRTANRSWSASGCSTIRPTATASGAAPLRHTSLRYFNVVGSGYDDLRDTSPHNLFPLIFERLVAGEVPTSMGTTTPHPTAPGP